MRPAALTTGTPAVDGASGSALTRRAGWIVGTVAVVASALILRAARGTNFFFDEWWFITHRRDASFDDFVRPHNGHLVAIPVAIYNALFRTVGLRSYTPYLLLLVGLHVLTCVLLFVYLRRRAPVLYALLAAVMMLLLGNAWQDLLWAFQITYLLSAAAGVGALLLLDRRDRVGDVGAMLAITASVLSGGLGLVFAGGALVELLWTRRDRRRLWIVAVPIAMYLVWYATNGASDGAFENLTHFDPYTTTLAGHAARSLLGTSLLVGKLIALVFLIIVAVQVVRTWPIAGRFANCIAMLVAYWLLLTYDRGNDIGGTESRYVYLSVLLMLLVGGEVLRTWQP
ncbi:MAG TPA: hypothetical protein VFZ17_09055, partial [Acidimicrobiia bacterium]|nr:hypothetical protein [Acidimicrobiia bacterium]